MKTLKNLFLEEIEDRYDSEIQLKDAMPKLMNSATCAHLKKLIAAHLKESEKQIKNLETIFKSMGIEPKSRKCQGTIGLLKEADEILASFKDSIAINAAIISIAQKIKHYEIASYGCLTEWSSLLKNNEASIILQKLLDQENKTNNSLIKIAVSRTNIEALSKDKCNSKDGSSCDSSSFSM